MTIQESHLQKLSLQLRNFGLNPLDWILSPLQSRNYLLQHREDHELALYGRLEFKNETPYWESLELASF